MLDGTSRLLTITTVCETTASTLVAVVRRHKLLCRQLNSPRSHPLEYLCPDAYLFRFVHAPNPLISVLTATDPVYTASEPWPG